jgi:hypothetical protein
MIPADVNKATPIRTVFFMNSLFTIKAEHKDAKIITNDGIVIRSCIISVCTFGYAACLFSGGVPHN